MAALHFSLSYSILYMIPPLILQPIVENAIKHGLLPKSSGGTIELSTQTEGKNVVITIVDDGLDLIQRVWHVKALLD